VAAALDGYAARWARMRTEACQATRRGEQSQELLDLRMECLDRRRDELGALVTVLTDKPDAALVERSAQVVASLTAVDECADARKLRAAPPPPPPEAQARLTALRAGFDRAGALMLAGRNQQAVEENRVVVAGARALGYRAFEAAALFRFGGSLTSVGAFGEAEQAFQGTLRAAADAGNDDLLARVWPELVFVVGQDPARREEAVRLAPLAEAAIARAGNNPEVLAYLHNNLAGVHAGGEDYAEAEKGFARALPLLVETFGEKHPHVALCHMNLAEMAGMREDYQAARRHYELALAIQDVVLAEDHPRRVMTLVGLAYVASEQARHADAQRLLEQALALGEHFHGAGHENVAGTRMALAEAIWAGAGDRERALALAREARAAWQAAGKAERVRQVDEWIAERPR
jgi:tetratricopeptide (TPR) repeat protein